MQKYKITFTVDYGFRNSDTDQKIVETDIDQNSDEFSVFIAKEAREMGNWEVMEDFNYENDRPYIEVVKIQEDPFVPKNASKYWVEYYVEQNKIAQENLEKYRAAKNYDDYLSLKLKNGDAKPTHRLKKDLIISDDYSGKGEEEGFLPKGSLAMLGNMIVWFLDSNNNLLKYKSIYGKDSAACWGIRVDYSGSGGSYYDMLLPLDEWFEEID